MTERSIEELVAAAGQNDQIAKAFCIPDKLEDPEKSQGWLDT